MTTLADLIGAPVHQGGRRIGYVSDLRAEVDRAEVDEGRLVVVGVLVAQRVRANLMGSERNEVDSPWLGARFLRWRNRGMFLLSWADVEVVDDEGLHVKQDARHRSPVLSDRGGSARASDSEG